MPPSSSPSSSPSICAYYIQHHQYLNSKNAGIGIEIVRKLGSEKKKNNNSSDNAFFCILGCRNEDLGRAAVEKLKSEGIMDIEFIRIDLQDLDSIQNAVQQIEETYGRCDVLVNNAAVCYNDPTLYGTTSHTPFAEQAEITVKTNFFGTLALTKAILPLMEKSSESPRIINIASSAGRLSILPSQDRRDVFSSDTLRMEDLESYMVDFIQAAKRGTHKEEGWPNTGYGVSKVGIIAMTKILARENSNNKFMVNSIDPGYCSTDQNNNQGFISAERGAITPYLLATIEPEQYVTGRHWYQEKEIEW